MLEEFWFEHRLLRKDGEDLGSICADELFDFSQAFLVFQGAVLHGERGDLPAGCCSSG